MRGTEGSRRMSRLFASFCMYRGLEDRIGIIERESWGLSIQEHKRSIPLYGFILLLE